MIAARRPEPGAGDGVDGRRRAGRAALDVDTPADLERVRAARPGRATEVVLGRIARARAPHGWLGDAATLPPGQASRA